MFMQMLFAIIKRLPISGTLCASRKALHQLSNNLSSYSRSELTTPFGGAQSGPIPPLFGRSAGRYADFNKLFVEVGQLHRVRRR
jgi:hypothetical protein